MTPAEYEDFVANVIRRLDFGADAVIQRNVRFAGVLQPGKYEIDVAVKCRVAGKFDFFLIVECKKWTRPVARPVVQALVQTRDAIAAHKAAIVSPTGFSAEALKVARVHGIAMWVLSEAEWSIPLGLDTPSSESLTAVSERKEFLCTLGMSPSGRQSTLTLISVDEADRQADHATAKAAYTHGCVGGAAVVEADNIPGIDPRTALSQLADEMGRLFHVPVVPPCRS